MIRRLYRSLTTTAATLALTTALAGPVTAQGVPTVDTQNIAQEIRQLQQMLQDFGIQTDLLDNALAQLDLLQQQFDQLEEMYASLTGRAASSVSPWEVTSTISCRPISKTSPV